MNLYDDVELNKEIAALADRGIHKGCYGVVVDKCQDDCLVLFLNKKNRGDYAFAWVASDALTLWDGTSEMFIDDIKEFVATHDPDEKPAFDILELKEYDLVELIVEHDSYASAGVHKGMRGVILQDTASRGKWPVTFSDSNGNDIAEISIPEKYLKKIK